MLLLLFVLVALPRGLLFALVPLVLLLLVVLALTLALARLRLATRLLLAVLLRLLALLATSLVLSFLIAHEFPLGKHINIDVLSTRVFHAVEGDSVR